VILEKQNTISYCRALLKKYLFSSSSNRPITLRRGVAMALVAVAAFYFAIQSSPYQEAALTIPRSSSLRTIQQPAEGAAEPKTPEEIAAAHRQNMSAEVRKGDNLFDLLKRKGIPPVQIHELVSAARPVHNLGRLQEGQVVLLDYDQHEEKIHRFETALQESRLIIERQEEELVAREEAFDYEIRRRVVSGVIEDSLCLAADKAGLPLPVTMALADIFAYDVDFNVDIRANDSFVVLFEEKYLDGRPVQTGRALAAGIENKGKRLWAFYFEDGARGDYYDEHGHSLRKAFLKSPLKYTRISSRFSKNRYHPVLKIYRPHLGVDYAAPKGTPIRSIGDGRILFAGWKGGYGRYVKIRHNGTYSSTYGHLDKFAKGIARGKQMRQGEIIGYVGATGLATGPHLDFRLLKNDKFINPLTVNFPDADPVSKEALAQFQGQVKQYVLEMNGAPSGAPPVWITSLRPAQITS
jgi:murein DD-endopeptidase MepM/ murein hydrolase activator NlpD